MWALAHNKSWNLEIGLFFWREGGVIQKNERYKEAGGGGDVKKKW